MILSALKRIGAKRPYFHILSEEDGSTYMGRWWLFGGSNEGRDPDQGRPVPRTWKRGRFDAWLGKFIACRLHHIVREDRARDFHNHPASFVSIVIKGWYRERRPYWQGQDPGQDQADYIECVRRPGSIAYRAARDRHTITEVSPGGCWTVVIWGRKQGQWGFFTRFGFVHWKKYGVQP